MRDPEEAKKEFVSKLEQMRQRITELERLETAHKQTKEALEQTLAKLRRIQDETVDVVASVVDLKDPYSSGHQQMVSIIACALANEMGLTEERIEGLRVAALLHDIGKVYVPATTLGKSGQLSESEFNMIKDHPRWGYDALQRLEFPGPVAQIVLQHHERLDGSGYPSGLSGEEIILEARILGVADVIEAMASHRPHREAPGTDKAMEEISKYKGVRYDTRVVDACLKLFGKGTLVF